jgi:hypothetical protein
MALQATTDARDGWQLKSNNALARAYQRFSAGLSFVLEPAEGRPNQQKEHPTTGTQWDARVERAREWWAVLGIQQVRSQ